MPSFRHFDLALINPNFDSPLLDVLTELEHLRRLRLEGTTPMLIFLQLKHVFHMLESLASARIEGNHTTLADYIDNQVNLNDADHPDHENNHEQLNEIANIEKAMAYVEEVMQPGTALSEHFIRQLHSITVQQLQREGDKTPGAYRTSAVAIAQSAHLPPDAINIAPYMQELVAFINHPHPPKYDLIKVALAHHRFGWIHPFSNGNGRVVRLITYALLIKYGFKVSDGGRVLNPAAVFCSDRERYYEMLSCADQGEAHALEQWCTYVLQGMLSELKKVDQLTRYDYLRSKIFEPALQFVRQRNGISKEEEAMLRLTLKLGVAKASDLVAANPKLSASQRTYQIKKLVSAKMLQPIQENARQYTIGFTQNQLLRGVIHALTNEGFISAPLQGNLPAVAREN